MSAVGTMTSLEVAVRFGRSQRWFRDVWRSLPGFPPPISGGGPHQHPLWRRADIDAYFAGRNFAAVAPFSTAARKPDTPANDAPPPSLDRRLSRLMLLSGND
jgi:hypothetical protein